MYSAKSSNSAKLSTEEIAKVNEVIEMITTNTDHKIDSFRDVVTVFADYIAKTKVHDSKPIENTIELTPSAYANLAEWAHNQREVEDAPYALSELNEYIKEAFPVNIPEPEIKEVQVEKELESDQVLITLNEDQQKIIEFIINARAKELSKKGASAETKEEYIKNCLFDESVLGNWSGEFYTGV